MASIRDIVELMAAEKNPDTCIGAALDLERYLNAESTDINFNTFIGCIDEKPGIYVVVKKGYKDIEKVPKTWHGFPINLDTTSCKEYIMNIIADAPLVPKLQAGDILLINNTSKTDLFSVAQRLVTGKPYTHTALGIGDIAGYDSVFEADLIVGCRPFNRIYLNHQFDYEQWRPVGWSDSEIKDILTYLYNEYAENEYGFGQIPWLAWVKLMGKLGVDLRKAKSWFPGGTICTQLVWHYLDSLANIGNNTLLKNKVNEWTDHNLCASDIADIVHIFSGNSLSRSQIPNLFTLIGKYKKAS